jgi:hypothetical protein
MNRFQRSGLRSLAVCSTLLPSPVRRLGEARRRRKRARTIYEQALHLVPRRRKATAAGASKDFLNPPPRDFTSGNYKIKSSALRGHDVPSDDDVFRMIRDGMPGTAMPGWSDLLIEQDMWDLVAYVKTFAGNTTSRPPSWSTTAVPFRVRRTASKRARSCSRTATAASSATARRARATLSKRLKGDAGERTWPRNLTKAMDLPRRQRGRRTSSRASPPAFPAPRCRPSPIPRAARSLSAEETWHVAHYVASLAKTAQAAFPPRQYRRSRPTRSRARLPSPAPDDARWNEGGAHHVLSWCRRSSPRNATSRRRTTPSACARCLRRQAASRCCSSGTTAPSSIPGDPDAAEKIADPPLAEDGVGDAVARGHSLRHAEALLRHGRRGAVRSTSGTGRAAARVTPQTYRPA